MANGLVFEDPRSGRRLELTPHTDLEFAGQIIREVTTSLGAALIDVRAFDGAMVADFRVSVGSLPWGQPFLDVDIGLSVAQLKQAGRRKA